MKQSCGHNRIRSFPLLSGTRWLHWRSFWSHLPQALVGLCKLVRTILYSCKDSSSVVQLFESGSKEWRHVLRANEAVPKAIFPYYSKVTHKRSVLAHYVKVCVMKARKCANVSKNTSTSVIIARLHFVDIFCKQWTLSRSKTVAETDEVPWNPVCNFILLPPCSSLLFAQSSENVESLQKVRLSSKILAYMQLLTEHGLFLFTSANWLILPIW